MICQITFKKNYLAFKLLLMFRYQARYYSKRLSFSDPSKEGLGRSGVVLGFLIPMILQAIKSVLISFPVRYDLFISKFSLSANSSILICFFNLKDKVLNLLKDILTECRISVDRPSICWKIFTVADNNPKLLETCKFRSWNQIFDNQIVRFITPLIKQ